MIINLPFSGIHRSLAAGGDDRPRLMLNHPNPIELVHPEEGRTAQNIRDWYDAQLNSVGLIHIARRCVKTQPTNSPLYDVVLASRKDTAIKLFEKANPVPKVEASATSSTCFGDSGKHLVLGRAPAYWGSIASGCARIRLRERRLQRPEW